MKRISFVVIALYQILTLPAWGQDIVWEKRGKIRLDEFYTVCPGYSGGYIAGGRFPSLEEYYPGIGYFDAPAIIKFSDDGDSIWTKKLPGLGFLNKLHHIGSGLTWAVIEAVQPFQQANNFYFPRAVLLLNDSIPLINVSFPNLHHFEVHNSYPTIDGGLIIFGSKLPGALPGRQKDFAALKINQAGQLVWSRVYPLGVSGFSTAGDIEPLGNGRYFMSGSDGRRLVSFEVFEDDGRDTLYRVWYDSPGNRVMEAPGLKHTRFNNAIINGIYGVSTNLNMAYFASHDKQTGQKIWGGEHPGGVGPTFSGIDGQFYAQSYPSIPVREKMYFTKFRQDSSVTWQIETSINSNGFRRGISSVLFLGNDSGIIAGVSLNVNIFAFWYIAKITGMGRPFDPTGQKYPHLVKHDALPYPNPTASRFALKKAFGKGEIHLFNLNGRCLLSKTISPGTEIDISHLPSGKYLYRAILDDEPHVGSVVKE